MTKPFILPGRQMEKPRQDDNTDKTDNFMMTGTVSNLFTVVSSLCITDHDPGSKYLC